VCEIDNPVQDCLDLRESDPEGPSNCWLNSDSFCFERIRFFDEPPEGLINFTDSDILLDSSAYCEPPECNSPCFAGGYVTQISVASVNSVIPPEWYTSPPILETTTTTYVIDWNFCNDTQGGTATCCPDDEPAFCSTNCPDVSCTIPTIEIDVTCQSFTRPTSWTNADSAIGCDFNSWYLDGTAESGTGKDDITGSLLVNNAQGCLFIEDAGVGAAQWPISHCIQPKPTTSTNPCEPSDCYQSWSCGGCQCGCLPLYPAYVAFSSNTLTFEADGSWTQQECIFQVPNIPINIVY
jgi:hypothetical protein